MQSPGNHESEFIFLYLMEFCAGMARGSYLVCIGWTTLIVIGDVAGHRSVTTAAHSPISAGPIFLPELG